MRTLFVALSIFVFACAAFGQTANGTITGTVTDPAGAVVASAPVQAKKVDTGAVFDVATSGTGNYNIAQLPVGIYEISVTAPGFKKAVRTGVEVAASTTFRVDFALEV